MANNDTEDEDDNAPIDGLSGGKAGIKKTTLLTLREEAFKAGFKFGVQEMMDRDDGAASRNADDHWAGYRDTVTDLGTASD